MKDFYEITTTKIVTRQQIDDFVATALEGGITHWCDKAVASIDTGDNYLSDMLTRGGSLRLHESGTDNWHTLTLRALLRAIGDRQVDFEYYDALDADAAVQRAVFGEVVYG